MINKAELPGNIKKTGRVGSLRAAVPAEGELIRRDQRCSSLYFETSQELSVWAHLTRSLFQKKKHFLVRSFTVVFAQSSF